MSDSLKKNSLFFIIIGLKVLAKTLVEVIVDKNLGSNHLLSEEIDVNSDRFLYTKNLHKLNSIKEAAEAVKGQLSQPGLYKSIILIEFQDGKIRIDDIALIYLISKTGICIFSVIAYNLPEKVAHIDDELLTKLNNGRKAIYFDYGKSGKQELKNFVYEIAPSFEVKERFTRKSLPSFCPKNPWPIEPIKNVIVIGNAGVGKSMISNSLIGEPVFEAGFSNGKALTRVLQEHTDERGIRFIDTPGLSDTKLEAQTVQGIRAALTREGLYKIIFVITLMSGRLNPDDKKMMKLVLEAAGFIKCSYAIIINKLEDDVRDYLENNLAEILDVLMEGLPFRTDSISYIPLKETSENISARVTAFINNGMPVLKVSKNEGRKDATFEGEYLPTSQPMLNIMEMTASAEVGELPGN